MDEGMPSRLTKQDGGDRGRTLGNSALRARTHTDSSGALRNESKAFNFLLH